MIQTLIDFSTALGPVRDQGARGMCLAFASSDFNQRENGLSDHLSVEYLAHHAAASIPGWTLADGLNFPAVVQTLAATGQPLESVYPYVAAHEGQPLIAPPLITRAAAGALWATGVSGAVRLPFRAERPATGILSLIVTGRPSSGPSGLPLFQRAADACACRIAPSGSRCG